MTYYHFIRVNEDGQAYLGNNDNRIVTVGEPVTVEGEPILCEHGLHASARIIDALEYCPVGNVALCRVTLGGTVIHGDDKSVASERTITAILPAEKTNALLQDFARWCALQVIDLWDAPDVVRQYLTTGDESLSEAAREAAAAKASDAAAWAAEAAAKASDAAARGARVAARAARAAARAAEAAAQETEIVRLFEAAGGGREP
jgi:predicted TIM-barrel fold metal-dependent hydrolase